MNALFEMLDQVDPHWVEILKICKNDIRQAKFIEPVTNFTPLHLAVKSMSPKMIRVEAIRSLLQADVDSVYVRCKSMDYTPLMYLCSMSELGQLEQNIPILRVFAEHVPDCFDDCGREALDLCTHSVSMLMQRESKDRIEFSKASSFLKVLASLVTSCAHADRAEKLFSYNSFQVIKLVTKEDERYWKNRDRASFNHDYLVTQTKLSESWIWEYLHILLRAMHQQTFRNMKPLPPFNALHTAVSIPDFPLPFLMLLCKAYPKQLETPNITDLGNLPLHSVTTWTPKDCGASRKSMAVTQLLCEDFGASKHRNQQGKTPLDLATESSSSGVALLSSFHNHDGTRRSSTSAKPASSSSSSQHCSSDGRPRAQHHHATVRLSI
jgi:ankyrin repeat protein